MYRTLLIALLLLVAVGISPAQTILDPADLHIGTGTTGTCAVGCGNHPNNVSATNLSIFLAGGGNVLLASPMILILGVPDFGSGTVAPTIDHINYYAGYASPNPAAATPVGTFSSALGPGLHSGDGYLNSGDANAYVETQYNGTTNNSNSWVNWIGAETLRGITGITRFALYAYEIDQTVGRKDLLDIFFSGSGLVAGTIAIAYGCNGLTGDASDGSCLGGSNDTYTTPFTEAGFVGTGGGGGGGGGGGNVPEPVSILLMGTVGLLVTGIAKRKFRLS